MTDDTISRQAALKAIQDLYPDIPRIKFGDNIRNWQQKNRQYIECENAIRMLPTSERKGHWIDIGSGQKCSECEEIQYGYDSYRYYCPNCGADMREVGQS